MTPVRLRSECLRVNRLLFALLNRRDKIMKLKIINFALLFFTSLTVSIAAVVQYPTEIAEDGAAAYYRFSETSGANVADASGNNRSLNLRGSYGRGSAELLFNTTNDGSSVSLTGGTPATSDSNWFTTTSGASVSDGQVQFRRRQSGVFLLRLSRFGDLRLSSLLL